MSARSEQRVLVIAGSTATGKTGTALELASRLNGELVGADSVQVYRGFDIGSAKPSAEELNGAAHHLIDVLDPDESIDAMIFADLADEAIARIAARGRLPIVVGGTGLWIRALLRGLVELPPVDTELRARLLEEGERSREALHARLESVDPQSAATIHPRDLVRVSRALEVFEQTGQKLSQLRAAHARGADRYRTHFCVLSAPEDHDARIDARLQTMLEAGWKEETASLLERWPRDARAFGSVGYAQLVEHLVEGTTWDDTLRRIRKATRIYARRQRTWFGGERGIDWRGTADELLKGAGRDELENWLR